jgi:hypothetical protein
MKNILISYVADVDNETEAQAHFNALMYLLPKEYQNKFLIFDVVDVEK